MRLLAVEKSKFFGPDPPLNPNMVEEVEAPVEDVKASGGVKGKKVEEAPVEVQKSEEEIAEEKMFEDFADEFMEALDKVKQDLTEYRGLSDPETGIKRVALWPKKLSKAEINRMK